jgi:hypothetical protein
VITVSAICDGQKKKRVKTDTFGCVENVTNHAVFVMVNFVV